MALSSTEKPLIQRVFYLSTRCHDSSSLSALLFRSGRAAPGPVARRRRQRCPNSSSSRRPRRPSRRHFRDPATRDSLPSATSRRRTTKWRTIITSSSSSSSPSPCTIITGPSRANLRLLRVTPTDRTRGTNGFSSCSCVTTLLIRFYDPSTARWPLSSFFFLDNREPRPLLYGVRTWNAKGVFNEGHLSVNFIQSASTSLHRYFYSDDDALSGSA